jgi:putative spermidine/putrescine transport system ATP-binding protein
VVGESDVTHVPANRRDMGMVFQAYSLFPNLTAADNVAFGLRVKRVPRSEREQRVADALEMVGLGEMARRRVDELSGGSRPKRKTPTRSSGGKRAAPRKPTPPGQSTPPSTPPPT